MHWNWCCAVAMVLVLLMVGFLQATDHNDGEVPEEKSKRSVDDQILDKRHFGVLKFGKRPHSFGTVKLGKRNPDEEQRVNKRPFQQRLMFGKRSDENYYGDENDETLMNNYHKRYSDMLDNLYLQSIIHDLKLRHADTAWQGKRLAAPLFGKRESSDLTFSDYVKKMAPKFGRRSGNE